MELVKTSVVASGLLLIFAAWGCSDDRYSAENGADDDNDTSDSGTDDDTGTSTIDTSSSPFGALCHEYCSAEFFGMVIYLDHFDCSFATGAPGVDECTVACVYALTELDPSQTEASVDCLTCFTDITGPTPDEQTWEDAGDICAGLCTTPGAQEFYTLMSWIFDKNNLDCDWCPGYLGSSNCCMITDPCGYAADGWCDCDGYCAWDEADC